VVIRILLLADTHLGFDLPVNPRINRRRRGHDFLANYATALQPVTGKSISSCTAMCSTGRDRRQRGMQAFE
jgi:hypothetical protein